MEVEIACNVKSTLEDRQRAVCDQFGLAFLACTPEERIGLAPNVTDATRQLNGLRVAPQGDASGWYIWAGGELDDTPDFYIPLRAQSLQTWAPLVLPYLGLPPGARFLLRDDCVQVWLDHSLAVA